MEFVKRKFPFDPDFRLKTFLCTSVLGILSQTWKLEKDSGCTRKSGVTDCEFVQVSPWYMVHCVSVRNGIKFEVPRSPSRNGLH